MYTTSTLYGPIAYQKIANAHPMSQIACVPSLETAREVISKSRNAQFAPNLLPVTASIPADLLTPTLAYLKVAEK
jgi:anthranilate synthase component 1